MIWTDLNTAHTGNTRLQELLSPRSLQNLPSVQQQFPALFRRKKERLQNIRLPLKNFSFLIQDGINQFPQTLPFLLQENLLLFYTPGRAEINRIWTHFLIPPLIQTLYPLAMSRSAVPLLLCCIQWQWTEKLYL